MKQKPPCDNPAPFRIWGENLDATALEQMERACCLPIAVRGALMPDAHMGYGLPIGGVLAVRNSVIPYAVGVDIACRMKMSILDVLPETFETDRGRFKIALESETSFGVGAESRRPKKHPVMDEDWSFCRLVDSLKDTAWRQLGTSGSGNHFAEFGILRVDGDLPGVGPGTYLAFLTHSGSRGAGAAVAAHYSRLAKTLHPELPRHLNDLAWLDLGRSEGQEYWKAMELMGRYASANHDLIHQAVLTHIGLPVLTSLENHHNFAWRMSFGGREMIVHRKGATPAGRGTIGIIPGSMASPAYIVRGRGNPDALDSAAHGAGRLMSRSAALKRFDWSALNRLLLDKGIVLISAGLDEVPMAYKDIDLVMAQQRDLVETIARFDPKLVKMAPPDRKAGRSRNKRKKKR